MKFTADLPEPLTRDIEGHQINVTAISPDQYITDLSKQFDIRNDQAETLPEPSFIP